MTVPLGSLPSSVRVVEVGPRDGLQNEPEVLPADVKVAFIEALAEAGLRWIEVGSFVRPDRVPQMANTEEVVRRLRPREGVRYIALVPNLRGLERAAACGIRTIAVFTAATDAFGMANLGMTVAASLRAFREVVREAHREGMHVRGYISVAWWCPYSGRADPQIVRRVALELLEMGCAEVSVADTVGAATPREVQELLDLLEQDISPERIGVHFHDTRGVGLVNVLAALQMKVTTVDASAGGLGGCPFAPGALGNVATEDVLYLLRGMGIETGADLERVRLASKRLETVLGRRLPSRVLQAGAFRSG
ncbi:MAG: hydroxymethylglutaryl-CoA lyase [Armatimonadota bacterium]|nr:hydroxymethylglutaryl-CoA lyase [Armatimonadota bacterium]MDR7439208.1 hydroxymethylglutaryl-CoA lyase [Armatimonadota bacterium]MDR7563686.1 hydroxymethylglutaryl-CoA lyase [Armatimonadota bacterium]MDR7568590.1 hydroxymethylglutaryl-CoA lyase [Armatimonadota bacterium]MDR7602006.1 hydroxymethylglutaryl-CoA lyase [Armatimonadota bacterium]